MGKEKKGAVQFPHVKGLAKKATKFGHRYVLTLPDSTGKSRSITVKILDTDPLDVFYRKVNDARRELMAKERNRAFESYVDEYVNMRQFKSNTEKSFRRTLRPYSLNPEINRKAILELLSSDRKKATISQMLNSIDSFFSWLASKREIENPAENLHVKSKNQPRTRIATDDEIDILVEHVRKRGDPEYLLFTLLIIYTGARVSTISACTAKSFDGAHIKLYNVKSDKPYSYPLPINNAEIGDLWKRVTADGVLWHVDPDKHHRRLIKQMYRLFPKNEDGETLTPHSLRHTFASKAIQSGVPLEIVSKLLDHQSISTTLSVYAKFSQNQIDDAVDKLLKNIDTD
jgi:integrase